MFDGSKAARTSNLEPSASCTASAMRHPETAAKAALVKNKLQYSHACDGVIYRS